jgi:hypothetical protein
MIGVLMPSWGDDPVRLENQDFVIDHYATEWGLGVTLGTGASRAHAVNDAARRSQADLFIIADNDLIPDARSFETALRLAETEPAVTPHDVTRLLTPAARVAFMNGGQAWPYRPTPSGSRSFVVMRRDVFAAVNGMDERFVGWGPEDKAFLFSIAKQVGPVKELRGARLHLWHRTDPSKMDRASLRRNRERLEAYRVAHPDEAAWLAREYGRWDAPTHGTTQRPGPPHDPPSDGRDGVAAGRHAPRTRP